jgi:clan AA aspartic protease (TIGR02281 family)
MPALQRAQFAQATFSTRAVANAFEKVLDAAASGGDAAALQKVIDKFEKVASDKYAETSLERAACQAIEDAMAERDVVSALAWHKAFEAAGLDAPYMDDLIEKYVEVLEDRVLGAMGPTLAEMKAVADAGDEYLTQVLDTSFPTTWDPRAHLAEHPDELKTYVQIATALPQEKLSGSLLHKDELVALCSSLLDGGEAKNPKIAAHALDGLVKLGAVHKDVAATYKDALKNGTPLALPAPFFLGVVTPEDAMQAIGVRANGSDDDKRAAICKALASGDRGLAAAAAKIDVSGHDLAGFLVTGAGVEGWQLNPFNHRGVNFPGETILAGSEVDAKTGAMTSWFWANPASETCADAKLTAFVQNKEFLPKVEVKFADRTVPEEAQKNLVGRKRWLKGEEVLALYAAATGQPKWLAHDELIHHQPRKAVVDAIGEYVGLNPEEVKEYFDEGGWGRLFHGSGDPILYQGREVPPGQIITEYLKLAPDALDDFLKAQKEEPPSDADGKPMPFPVSETAVSAVAGKLNLEERDVKTWLEKRRFFTGDKLVMKRPRLEPEIGDNGKPVKPVAQDSFTAADLAAIAGGDVAETVRLDAFSRAMLPHVPSADEAFLKIVGEKVTTSKSKTEAPVLTVTRELLEDMGVFAKNTAHLKAELAEQSKPKEQPKKALEKLMELPGLDEAKKVMKQAFALAEQQNLRKEAGKKPVTISLHARFEGNPGTGKTTVARLYGEGLKEAGVLSKGTLIEVGGAELLSGGLSGFQKKLEEAKGGVLLIDEIYQLDPQKNEVGRQIAEYLLKVMEDQRDDLVIIATGYTKQLEEFVGSNPGFNRRFAQKVPFEDYSDGQLKQIMQKMVKDSDYEVTDTVLDKAVRRIARLRGPGFGNAGAVRNVVEKAIREQMLRVSESKVSSDTLEDHDFFGDESARLASSPKSLESLGKLTGLDSVKKKLDSIKSSLLMNAEREELGMPPAPISLHAAFLGNPGTGKTTVAKIYGAFLKEMGLLSDGEVLVVKREDLVGSVLGETEKKTKAVLERARGKVLVIDEAYALHSNLNGDFGQIALDTLVGQIQGTAGEDICLVMCGYTDKMRGMFQNANPGLQSRVTQEFVFEDYDDAALRSIVDNKIKSLGMSIEPAALDALITELSRQKQKPNFGNARSAESMVAKISEAQAERLTTTKVRDQAAMSQLTVADVDAVQATLRGAEGGNAGSLNDLVGLVPLKKKMKELKALVEVAKRRGEDPRKYYQGAYLFAGPPGTGKTTAARLMGNELRDMGFLASSEVVEIQARDLIAGFQGQTNEKTLGILESALGKVLFIDEAYGLADPSNSFAAEAIDKLLKFQSDHKNEMCIVLAGYDRDLDRVLETNQGLRSRFTNRVPFESASASDATTQVQRLAEKANLKLGVKSDALLPLMETLRAAPGWSSFRDAGTLFDTATTKQALRVMDDDKADPFELTLVDFQEALDEVLLTKGVSASSETIEVSIPMGNREMIVEASVNGVSAKFCVDTGAMGVSIDRKLAEQAGLDLSSAVPVPIIGATGVDSGWKVTIDRMSVGGIVVENVDAIVQNNCPGGYLLGMSFLQKCGMQFADGLMKLTGRGGGASGSPASSGGTHRATGGGAGGSGGAPRIATAGAQQQPRVNVGTATETRTETRTEAKAETETKAVAGVVARTPDAFINALNDAVVGLSDAAKQKMIDTGTLPKDVLEQIKSETKQGQQSIEDRAKQILKEIKAEQDKAAKIAAELAAKKKRVEVYYICGVCGREGCPVLPIKYTREVQENGSTGAGRRN